MGSLVSYAIPPAQTPFVKPSYQPAWGENNTHTENYYQNNTTVTATRLTDLRAEDGHAIRRGHCSS